jgi:taurine dioxygenase
MTQAPTRPATLTLDRLGPAFGAEVIGLDLRLLDDEQVNAVRQALVTHKVLFFRGQDLTDADQVDLGRRLGEPTAGHPVASSDTVEHPEIYDIDSADPEFSFSDVWHTDVTFVEKPPLGSILRAVRLPSYGGDTSWVDSQLAYESLSAPVQRLVDQLTAVHDGNREWGAYLRRHGNRGNVWDGEQVTELTPVEHPVVRVHPESGRKGLFVNPGFTSHVVGVSDAESRAILDLLYAHLTKPEHTIRHRWRAGDVGIWDNRSTSHYANRDYTEVRTMRRITLAGDRPVGPAGRPSRTDPLGG